KVALNEKVGNDIFRMRLLGDTSAIKRPGEFINLTIPGFFLRRPISVFDFGEGYVDILYKVLGKGTLEMSQLTKGTLLDVLTGLGNGFEIKENIHPTLIGGGIGIAPLYCLALSYAMKGIRPTLIYGARSENDLVLLDEFKKICDIYLCTDDGTKGIKGTVLDCIKENNIKMEYYYACGPYKMLQSLALSYPQGVVSLEARMGCGFGACMGCSIQTINGPKRVCKEGPVFESSEVIF
ncbi:MAG: dihydroorotate dehydrogenase electron transfer subunit, partial [Bacilli bacterium]